MSECVHLSPALLGYYHTSGDIFELSHFVPLLRISELSVVLVSELFKLHGVQKSHLGFLSFDQMFDLARSAWISRSTIDTFAATKEFGGFILEERLSLDDPLMSVHQFLSDDGPTNLCGCSTSQIMKAVLRLFRRPMLSVRFGEIMPQSCYDELTVPMHVSTIPELHSLLKSLQPFSVESQLDLHIRDLVASLEIAVTIPTFNARITIMATQLSQLALLLGMQHPKLSINTHYPTPTSTSSPLAASAALTSKEFLYESRCAHMAPYSTHPCSGGRDSAHDATCLRTHVVTHAPSVRHVRVSMTSQPPTQASCDLCAQDACSSNCSDSNAVPDDTDSDGPQCKLLPALDASRQHLHTLLAHGVLHRWVPALNCSSSELRELLVSYSFNVFELPLATHPECLLQLAFFMFHDLQLPQALGIDAGRLYRFIYVVSLHYNDRNYYHNWAHGFSTMHFTYLAIKHVLLYADFDVDHLFAMLVAAMCHDIGHPGNNNAFENALMSPLSVLYNGNSVLENHHCFLTFYIMRNPRYDANVLSHLPRARVLRLRGLVINAIMGTDMAVHDAITAKLAGINDGIDARRAQANCVEGTQGLDRWVWPAAGCMPTRSQVLAATARQCVDADEDAFPEVSLPTEAPCPDCDPEPARRAVPASAEVTSTIRHANERLTTALAACAPVPTDAEELHGPEGYIAALPRLGLPAADTAFLCTALVHMADISCQSLAPRPALAWSERLRYEFSLQSKREEIVGLPRTSFMCGLDSFVAHARAQSAFLRMFMRPLWVEVARTLPNMAEALVYMDNSVQVWADAEAAGVLDVMDADGLGELYP